LTDQGNEPWREALRAENQKRRRRPRDQRAVLRRITITTAVAAASLNAALFVQAGLEQVGPGDFQNLLVTTIHSIFPGAGLQPASQAPTPSAGAPAVATTGGS
jgi:broad specificity phosphatase PhoE